MSESRNFDAPSRIESASCDFLNTVSARLNLEMKSSRCYITTSEVANRPFLPEMYINRVVS